MRCNGKLLTSVSQVF